MLTRASRFPRCVRAAAIAALVTTRLALAGTIHVPADQLTIQDAIAVAANGDTIQVAPGVYTEALNLLGKQLVIEGTGGAVATTLDGQGLGVSILTATSGEPVQTTIRGFTFMQGEGTFDTRCLTGFVGTALFGGAAFIAFSGMTFEDCVFDNNGNAGNGLDFAGGAIYLDVADVRILDCEFRYNGFVFPPGATYHMGAAIFTCTSGGSLQIHDSVFENNGNLSVYSTVNVRGVQDLEILRCRFRDNLGGGTGGALYLQTGTDTSPGFDGAVGTALVKDCLFERNRGSFGGAASLWSTQYGTTLLEDCTFLDNVATGGGGLELVSTYGDLTAVPPVVKATRCFFARNKCVGSGTAVVGGGLQGIVSENGLLEVSDSIFIANSAQYRGGALAGTTVQGGLLRATGCTMLENVVGNNAGAVAFDSQLGGSLELVNSIMRGNAGSVQYLGVGSSSVRFSDVEGGVVGLGNIDATPGFVVYPDDGGDGWGDNIATVGIDESLNDDFGDLRLVQGSPCVDAGDTTVLADPANAVDYNGLPRVLDDPNAPDTGITVTGAVIDIGAHEQQGPWTGLGGGTPGAAGIPELAGSGFLVPATTVGVYLTRTPAFTSVLLWISVQSLPFPFAGGTVYAFPPNLGLLLQADADGAVTLAAPWPPGLPSQVDIFFQAAVQDGSVPQGFTLSNAVKATQP